MQTSDLMQDGKPRKGLRVKVRVPEKHTKKLGEAATGEFVGFARKGRQVTVNVSIGGRKYGFRPQDVERA